MLIQDISSPLKYKLSNIEISFSPPYFAQIDSVKKFKFSRQDITWSEYSCNHCQHYPTFYLQSFITICSSIFKKKASFHIIPLISHQARHVFFTNFVFNPNQNEIEVLVRSVRPKGRSPQSCTVTDFEMETSNFVLFLLISVVSVHFRAIYDETIRCQA